MTPRDPTDAAALVGRLIARQFPQWADLPIQPVEPGGWDNRTYRLGDRMTVRLPSAAHYAAAIDKEQIWLPRLAPQLPLPIPTPLARGEPDEEFPWPWSVYAWLDGDVASPERIIDEDRFAADLAAFLRALQRMDTSGGPSSAFRGGSLDRWDAQFRSALSRLHNEIDVEAAAAIWTEAITAPMAHEPVWFHGDVAAGNLLVRDGRLCAVIDFGGLAVGDPACDTTIAWTFFSPASRTVFRAALAPSDDVWSRGRGWALWKGAIILARLIDTNELEAASAGYAVDQLIDDYRRRTGTV